jgi:pyruvate formate lyase activating enzyme
MLFAGLQKNSLIDYPGKVSCVLFVTGCNLACPFCHNPELALGRYPQRITGEEFLQFIEPRRSLLDAVVISGGEPTLNPDVADMCQKLHDMGLAVKLDTNGGRPEVLAHLISHGLVDYIAMDIKTSLDNYAPVLTSEEIGRCLERSIALIMQAQVDYEFRTTCVRPFVDDEHIGAIAHAIQGARRYVLQAFRPSVLLRPSFFTTDHPGFSSSSMQRLRQLAEPYVAECLVRG